MLGNFAREQGRSGASPGGLSRISDKMHRRSRLSPRQGFRISAASPFDLRDRKPDRKEMKHRGTWTASRDRAAIVLQRDLFRNVPHDFSQFSGTDLIEEAIEFDVLWHSSALAKQLDIIVE